MGSLMIVICIKQCQEKFKKIILLKIYNAIKKEII